MVSADPVALGLVTSLNRPERNVTGISNLVTKALPKRLELLHELAPTATSFAFLLNPNNPMHSAAETNELQVAATTLGVRLLILNASDQSDLEMYVTKLNNAANIEHQRRVYLINKYWDEKR